MNGRRRTARRRNPKRRSRSRKSRSFGEMFPGRPTLKTVGDMSMSASPIAVPASSGVPTSLEDAYREWADTTARWAQRLGGPEVDSDDVVQDVFIVVARELGRFRGDARFSTWLFEITRKITANHRRRHGWRRWSTRAAQDLHGPAWAGHAPD